MFSVEITATYTTSGPNNNWHDDLKKAIRHAGEKKKPTVFLFSDAQIVNETMVGDALVHILRVCLHVMSACMHLCDWLVPAC